MVALPIAQMIYWSYFIIQKSENHNEESTEKKGSRCYPGYPGYRPYTSGSGAAAAAAASAASFGRTNGAAPFLLGPPGVIAPRTGGAAFSHASGVAYGGASGPWLNPATNKAAANANAMAASQGISPSFGRTNSIQRTAASAGAQSFAANNGGYFGAPVVVPRNHYNRFYPGSAGSAAAAAASAASNTGGYTYG